MYRPLLLALLVLASCGKSHRESNSVLSEKTSDSTTINPETESTIDVTSCAYDNLTSSIGIGLVIAPAKFSLYTDSLLRDKEDLDMYSDASFNICSKYFKPDYGIMHFVCVERTAKYFKVLSNYDQVRYMPATNEYGLNTWEKYILESYGVRRIADDEGQGAANQVVRENATSESNPVAIPEGLEMFCPVKLKGDWLMVKYDCFYNDDSNPYEGQTCSSHIDKCEPEVMGWIKWRENNRILIDIFLMP